MISPRNQAKVALWQQRTATALPLPLLDNTYSLAPPTPTPLPTTPHMPSRPPQTAYIPKVEPAPDGLDLLASKIGGRPYLVAGESWPSHNGSPMVRAGAEPVHHLYRFWGVRVKGRCGDMLDGSWRANLDGVGDRVWLLCAREARRCNVVRLLWAWQEYSLTHSTKGAQQPHRSATPTQCHKCSLRTTSHPELTTCLITIT